VGDFQSVVNGPHARPYHTGKTAERWSYNLNYRATPAELRFTHEERTFAQRSVGRVIVEPFIKPGASPNKQWGERRWRELVRLLVRDGHRVALLGAKRGDLMPGAEWIWTPTFLKAAAVLAVSRCAVLPEGGLHHAAAAVGLPAVVIFGGFTPVDCTGYEAHYNIGASGQDACGMRIPCGHCTNLMSQIEPEAVVASVDVMLKANGHEQRWANHSAE
jgi:hypothetical protein